MMAWRNRSSWPRWAIARTFPGSATATARAPLVQETGVAAWKAVQATRLEAASRSRMAGHESRILVIAVSSPGAEEAAEGASPRRASIGGLGTGRG